MVDTETWHLVQRRRRFPDHWRPGKGVDLPVLIPRTNTYLPHQTAPTYAQVVAQTNPSPKILYPQAKPSSPSPPSSPTPPTSPQSPTYYISPHSPERLRFPPSSRYEEWKNRCFNCCRRGHRVSKCRNQKRCGKCWKFGHTGNKCKEGMLNPKAPPYWPAPKVPTRVINYEPGFTEILQKPKPLNPHYMPPNRPKKIVSYMERDGEYYHEVSKLQNSVILYTSNLHFQLSVDKVAEYAAETGLVKEKEVRISMMSKARYVIFLPEGLAPETFIEATPQHLWDMGLSFQKWNQLEDGELHNPAYKVLMDIVGFPPPLYRESAIIRAVSRFGLYLGSVAQQHQEDISRWSTVVAVKELEEVPDMVSLVIGGIEHEAEVKVQMWSRGPVFKGDDMPKPPDRFHGPKPKETEETMVTEIGQSSAMQNDSTESDSIKISRRALIEICKDRDVDSFSPELREFLQGITPCLTSWKPMHNCTTTRETPQVSATKDQEGALHEILHESSTAKRLHHSLAVLHEMVATQSQSDTQPDQSARQTTLNNEMETFGNIPAREEPEAGQNSDQLQKHTQQTTQTGSLLTRPVGEKDRAADRLENEKRDACSTTQGETVIPLCFSSPSTKSVDARGKKLS